MPCSAWRTFSVAAAMVALVSATGALLTLAAPAVAATHQVQIADSAFGTATLTVRVGDTVTWNNADDRPHTVTSQDGAFDSGNLDEGASFSFTFSEAGTYAYLCEYHPDMRGTIIVEPASSATTAPAAASSPSPAAAGGAGQSAVAHATHQPGAGDQPDTALPMGESIPSVSLLLWGLGLLVMAIGIVPTLRATPAVRSRPPGGWRR
jgi:plastocyanin